MSDPDQPAVHAISEPYLFQTALLDAREDRRSQPQREGRYEERDHEALDQRPTPAAPLPQDPKLGPVQISETAHALDLRDGDVRSHRPIWRMSLVVGQRSPKRQAG